jgi:chromosome segregation ATPase
MATRTAAEGQAAAQRLSKEQQALSESLIGLEEHSGRKLIENTAVTGLTRQRREHVLDGIATLWIDYKSYRSAVARIRAIMASSRPAQGELLEVEQLVTDATNDLATIHTLYGAINTVEIAEAHKLLAQCQQARAGLHTLWELREHAQRRLDQVHRTLTEVQARELLWRAPCDLAAAAAAVRGYQNAVNETPASGDVA